LSERSIYLETLDRANWIAPVSRHMLEFTLTHAPHIAGKASVVYNGIPADQMPARISPPNFSTPSILWIGRMVEWKRVDRVIDAMALLVRDYPDLRLVLAGDGPARSALEAQVAAVGLSNRVTFTGWVDSETRSDLLRAATGVVIPSQIEENLPMVALEAASAGRVIIGAAVSGLPEIVEHNQSGLLFTDIDPPALASAITVLLADPARTIAMGRRASELVRARFREELMVGAYLSLYQQIASG
jgi:glycogen(starch) synthase